MEIAVPAEIVITSYSIHYTKLYEITPRLPDTETEPDAHSNVPEKSSVETGLEILV